MINVVVTGAQGFIGRNLCAHLQFRDDVRLEQIVRDESELEIERKLSNANVVVHLAGVNRPSDPTDFEIVNEVFTKQLLQIVAKNQKPCKIIFSSSTQAALENPYGSSKKNAEVALEHWVKSSGGQAVIFRLPGVFGKWCKPDYNSVVATFCHNIAHDKEITLNNPATIIKLVYIDDVIRSLLQEVSQPLHPSCFSFLEAKPTYQVTLEELAEKIRQFHYGRKQLYTPVFNSSFDRALYATYLSYLPENDFQYNLPLHTDERGVLFECFKNTAFGQVFLSTTKKGITRGNHFHHTKAEKFLVIKGEAVVRFRKVGDDNVIEYPVTGERPSVVDIPPGYTHHIENTGTDDLIVLFWANEIFNNQLPDTQFLKVLPTINE